ncbi:UbiA family prenyltransferase [Kaustia mangrovi]|nr:UbiA family prenyltransferase [Kaustia mangrovi]
MLDMDTASSATARAVPGGTVAETPLVLDLDRSLIRADMLHEMALTYIRRNPLRVLHLVGWALKGRAILKRKLAERVRIDVEGLPVNEELAAYAADEHGRGRKVVLATATDMFLAQRIAQRFAFIDEVVASDGVVNLKGRHKADRLSRLYPDGFAYAGDSRADLAVWPHSDGIILVEPSRATERAARRISEPELTFPRTGRLKALLKAVRPHQWAKNALVFVPLVLAGRAGEPEAWVGAGLAFLALGLLASATYLLNDLWDLPEDRRHWSKRDRPLASGRMSVAEAAVLIPLGLLASFAVAAIGGIGVVAMIALYLAVTLAYSLSLKRQPILDALTLATLFTIRLGLGIVATGVAVSPWLMVFSMFLFVSLSFAKRHTEIARMASQGKADVAGRGYRVGDGPLVLAMGVASGLGAVLIMVQYLLNDAFNAAFYGTPLWLWAFPPVLFLWVSRIWLLCHRGELNDDPVAFAVRDRVSIALGAAMVLAFLAAWAGVSP